jgi:AraC-like DNA-binding protein
MDGRITEARIGDLLLYPAGRKHEESSDPNEPVESIFLGLNTSDLDDLPFYLHDGEGRVRTMAHWLYEDRHSAVPAIIAAADTLLSSLFAELLRIHANPTREAELVTSARAYIRRHLTEEITLDRLARHAGLSKFYFNRLFRKLAQRTPAADVREIRLSHARDLILSTNLPLKSIAPKVGFSDEFHLSRLIRRYHGISPGALRKKARWR